MAPLVVGLLLVLAPAAPSAVAPHDASAAATAVLDCTSPIGAGAPDRTMTRVGGAVALVTSQQRRALGTSPLSDPAAPFIRRFAKTGLMVRTAGPGARLLIPRAWRGRVAMSWGNTDHDVVATESLSVGPCPGPSGWVTFPGGYYVDRPACVSLIVRVAGHDDTKVRVGVGAPCLGQRPAVTPPAA